MSGGVDSAVAALRLLEQGYQVQALFMKNWEEDDKDGHCSAARDLEDASRVCERLGIALSTVNFASEYWDNVFEHFLEEHRLGRTPNPDILCNTQIKFRAFLDHALGLGADCIATGHYARCVRAGERWRLLRSADDAKDQTYFLHRLQQEQLAPSLFPVGELRKSQVRSLARTAGLENHARKDSTGICFIGERNFQAFLDRFLPARRGEIRSLDDRVLGEHTGLMHYTIGQRRGIGIGGRHDASAGAWYVARKDLEDNVLRVVQGHDHPALFTREVSVAECHWIAQSAPETAFPCTAKLRYRQRDHSCDLQPLESGGCRLTFDQPQRAVTPGQHAVFYRGEECLGGGIIEASPGGAA
jgi:tRNA-specific 2-thiouridylase